jgi:NifU-like protein involved in Fe-S cluster formation
MYSATVEKRFRNPQAAGALPLDDTDVVDGEAGSIEKAAWVRFYLRIGAGRVIDARFKAYGCPHTLAAADWVAEHAVGETPERAFPEGAAQLLRLLEAPTEKLGRLLIVEDALREAARRALAKIRAV